MNTSKRKKIYLNEYNIPMEDAIYLPIATGTIRAYCEIFSEIKEKYEFQPFIFHRDTVNNILDKYDDPTIAGFSVSMWNYRLSLAVATAVKKKFPDCLIVFGGPSVPKEAFYPIDKVIHGNGESEFASLLLGREVKANIKSIPSPYTSGLFDYLMNDDITYQAIIETNRGCPFRCAYCYWGNGESKYQFFDLERVRKEADWIGRNKIPYVFCADSNFGTFVTDSTVADIYAKTKIKYGFPEKFRVCYGKTAQHNIFRAAKILHLNGLGKSVTLAMQSLNKNVIKNIGRTNMDEKQFGIMQKKYKEAGIPTYSELILGLPGETLDSFVFGVNQTLKYAGNNKLFIYHCSVLPNTLLADKEYQEKYGIKTVKIPISEVHCKIRTEDMVTEYEEIIIETNTMSKEDWIHLMAWSWFVQLEYSLGIKDIPEDEENRLFDIARDITEGKSRCQILPEFGNIYFEPEEAAFLRIKGSNAPDKKAFAIKHILHGRKNAIPKT